MPIFFALIAGIGALAGRSAEKSRAEDQSGQVGVVDHAGFLDLTLAKKLATREEKASQPHAGKSIENLNESVTRFVAFPDFPAALREVNSGKLAACYVIEADYLSSGKITSYTIEKGFFRDLVVPGRGPLADLIRASLLKERVPDATLDRILNPAKLTEMKVNNKGEVLPASDQFQKAIGFLGPFGVALLLTISIFTTSGYLLQSTSEEKHNRVIEVILSSVKPDQLLVGKILGLGAAGLLQVAFYILFLILPSVIAFAAFKVSFWNLLISFSYFLLGFLLFGGIMASCGMLGNNLQESAQLSTVFTLTSMMPMMLMGVIMQSPDGTLARVFSFIPLTAPVMMLIRTGMGKPPWIDYLISYLSLLIGIYLAIRITAKIFRFASLMYGKRPTIAEIVRWLKVA
jgi:ABC-2 type transport system permease protein